MCVSACVRAYTHTRVCVCHARTCVCVSVHVCGCVCVCLTQVYDPFTNQGLHVCVRACAHTRARTCVRVCARVHARACVLGTRERAKENEIVCSVCVCVCLCVCDLHESAAR